MLWQPTSCIFARSPTNEALLAMLSLLVKLGQTPGPLLCHLISVVVDAGIIPVESLEGPGIDAKVRVIQRRAFWPFVSS